MFQCTPPPARLWVVGCGFRLRDFDLRSPSPSPSPSPFPFPLRDSDIEGTNGDTSSSLVTTRQPRFHHHFGDGDGDGDGNGDGNGSSSDQVDAIARDRVMCGSRGGFEPPLFKLTPSTSHRARSARSAAASRRGSSPLPRSPAVGSLRSRFREPLRDKRGRSA